LWLWATGHQKSGRYDFVGPRLDFPCGVESKCRLRLAIVFRRSRPGLASDRSDWGGWLGRRDTARTQEPQSGNALKPHRRHVFPPVRRPAGELFHKPNGMAGCARKERTALCFTAARASAARPPVGRSEARSAYIISVTSLAISKPVKTAPAKLVATSAIRKAVITA
jgi:hypothetical protein